MAHVVTAVLRKQEKDKREAEDLQRSGKSKRHSKREVEGCDPSRKRIESDISSRSSRHSHQAEDSPVPETDTAPDETPIPSQSRFSRSVSRVLKLPGTISSGLCLRFEIMFPCLFKELPFQALVLQHYDTTMVQVAVAVLIFGNFIVSATQAQILPDDGTPWAMVFVVFEYFFNFCFTIELLVNIYGNWFIRFWSDSWNWFDFVIVIISLMSMFGGNLPAIGVLRLFRAFRVFRLFKRIKSLKLIITGVLASLPGVRDAFIVLGLIMSIWSIMGVSFFGDIEEYEHLYGNFAKAMLTMFQVMTLDSWASQVARPILFDVSPVYSLYFISYIFINGVMMTNIVVAVLLDKFVESMHKMEEEEAAEKMRKTLPDSELGSEGGLSRAGTLRSDLDHILDGDNSCPFGSDVLLRGVCDRDSDGNPTFDRVWDELDNVLRKATTVREVAETLRPVALVTPGGASASTCASASTPKPQPAPSGGGSPAPPPAPAPQPAPSPPAT